MLNDRRAGKNKANLLCQIPETPKKQRHLVPQRDVQGGFTPEESVEDEVQPLDSLPALAEERLTHWKTEF